MRVAFADCALDGLGDIGAKNDIVKRSHQGRAMGEVADGNGRRSTTVLVKKNNIAEAFSLSGHDEVGEDEVTTV